MKHWQMMRMALVLAIISVALLQACSGQGDESAAMDQTTEAQSQPLTLTTAHSLTMTASTPTVPPPEPTNVPPPTSTSTPQPTPTDTPRPTATNTSEPTLTPTATPSPEPPGPPPLTGSDPQSVIEYIIYLMRYREFSLIDNVVGNYGAHFDAPYAAEFVYPRYDNGSEIAQDLADAFRDTDPVCLGYVVPEQVSDKGKIFFDGFNFGHGDSSVGFFLLMDLGYGWQVAAVVSLPSMFYLELDSVAPCSGE